MSDALVQVIKEHTGWTMFCIVVLVIAIASGVESFLINISKRRKG